MSPEDGEIFDEQQTAEDVQALVKVAEEELLSWSDVLKILLSKLPHAEKPNFSVVAKGICDVLLMELRTESRSEKYICPYGLRDPQHPFITILAAQQSDGHEIVGRVRELFGHQDKHVCQASRAFLKPVFLYVVKNLELLPYVRILWSYLVNESAKDAQGCRLFLDCLAWLSCEKSTILTNTLLTDALEALIPAKKPEITGQVLLAMAGSLRNQVKLGLNPNGSFRLILCALKSGFMPQRVILLICSHLLEDIPPHHIDDLLLVVRYLVDSAETKGFLIRSMLLDSLVFWSHEEFPISSEAKDKITYLRESIENRSCWNSSQVEIGPSKCGQFFPDRRVSCYMDIEAICCIVEEHFARNELPEVIYLLDMMKNVVDPVFVHLFCKLLRGILTYPTITLILWRQVLEILVIFVKTNEEVAMKTLLMLQSQLNKPGFRVREPEVVQGIVECGHFKTHHDTIISLIDAYSGNDNEHCLKLYLRLWQIDSSTYLHLHEELMETQESPLETVQLARAEAIRAICEQNPTHHRHDLLESLLDLLHQSDEVVCIALEAFIHLCDGHSKRTLKAWKKLESMFRDDERTKIITTLCRFYQHVPKYSMLSPDHAYMTKEVFKKLWDYALESKDQEVQKAAFEALGKFPFEMIKNQLKDENSETCWLQLLRKVDKRSINFVGDFIAELIRQDESDSILQEIVQFINHAECTDDILIHSLRILSQNWVTITSVNWKRLNNVFLRSEEVRPYCVVLAIKQMTTSSTAQEFLNIFLQLFLPDVIDAVFEQLPTLLSNVDPENATKYLHLFFKYALKDNTLSSRIQKLLPLLEENHLSLVVEVLQSLQFHDFIYGDFQAKHRDFWFKFALQQEVSVKRYICSKLAQQHQTTELLDPILKHISDSASEFDSVTQWEDLESLRDEVLKVFLKEEPPREWNQLYKLAPICCSNKIVDEDFFNWILHILMDMKLSLTIGSKDFENYCKIFMNALQVFSTYFPVQSVLYGYEICDEISKFPYSLALISEKPQCKDHCTQIYEYLCEMISMPQLPENILTAFQRSLMLAKDLPYFEQESTWTKMMMNIR